MAPDAIAVGPMLIALSVGNGWVGIFETKFYANSNGHLMVLILNLNINLMRFVKVISLM